MYDPLNPQRTLEYLRAHGVPIVNSLPDGWGVIEKATTAPSGYVWINNRKSIFTTGYRHALMKKQPKQLSLW